MSRVLVSLNYKSLCVRIVFFLSLLVLAIVLLSLCLLTRHYFHLGPTPQNPRFFHS